MAAGAGSFPWLFDSCFGKVALSFLTRKGGKHGA